MRSVRVSNAMLSALTREPSQGRNNQTFTSKRSGSSVENGLEKVHLKKGKQWKVTPKVKPGLRQRGRRKGVNSREGMAETDAQIWPWQDRYQG